MMAISDAQRQRNLNLLTDIELRLEAVGKLLGQESNAIDKAELAIFSMRNDSETVDLDPKALAQTVIEVMSKAMAGLEKENDVQADLNKSDVKRSLNWIDRRVQVFSESDGTKNIKPVVPTATSNQKLLQDALDKVDDICYDLGVGSS